MRAIWCILGLISVLAMMGITNSSQAQGLELGRYEYLSSCASCHGTNAKGDGPVAKSLKRTPADLTGLSEANKGIFPFSRIYDVIDGRFEVETHGKREMPVWGQTYQPKNPSTTGTIPPYLSNALGESFVRGRILSLVEYISTLQGK
jgi:hypothetical protein